jgi:hypothetical protein
MLILAMLFSRFLRTSIHQIYYAPSWLQIKPTAPSIDTQDMLQKYHKTENKELF